MKKIDIETGVTTEKEAFVIIPTLAIAWGDGVTIGILWGMWSAFIEFNIIKQPKTEKI